MENWLYIPNEMILAKMQFRDLRTPRRRQETFANHGCGFCDVVVYRKLLHYIRLRASGGDGVPLGKNSWANDVYSVSSGNYADDIDDQSSGNYDYDAIGNLIKDNQEEIAEIKWTVYGKISEIIRGSTSTKPDLAFEYGPDGNRVIKIVKPKSDNHPWVYTYYVRDASGNVMATYSRESNKKIQYDQITFSQINDTLIHDKGASEWRDFMADTNIADSAFKSDYVDNVLANSLGIDFLKRYNITST